jgi:hypothetical protein
VVKKPKLLLTVLSFPETSYTLNPSGKVCQVYFNVPPDGYGGNCAVKIRGVIGVSTVIVIIGDPHRSYKIRSLLTTNVLLVVTILDPLDKSFAMIK